MLGLIRPSTLVDVLRILIADDHPATRRALADDLTAGGIEVCAEAASGTAAVHAALRERPDLCLLDIQMPEGDGGLVAAEEILRSLPATRVLLITATPSSAGADAAARLGAHGYVGKDISAGRLVELVRAVADGDTAYL
jgi:DNA-binding NarL/FixJ family response regulator